MTLFRFVSIVLAGMAVIILTLYHVGDLTSFTDPSGKKSGAPAQRPSSPLSRLPMKSHVDEFKQEWTKVYVAVGSVGALESMIPDRNAVARNRTEAAPAMAVLLFLLVAIMMVLTAVVRWAERKATA